MNKTSPTMTIFAGPNGAGKSSLREILSREVDFGTEIDPDAIAKSKNLSDIQAARETINKVDECIQNRVSFSLETTLSGNLIMRQIHKAKVQGYHIQLIFVSLDSPNKHLDRIEQRVIEGGHNINADDVVRRYQRSHENLSKAISVVDKADVYTNVANFKMVVRAEHGNIIERSIKIPDWANSILNQFDHHPEKLADRGGIGRARVCSIRCQTSTASASKCRCVCGGKNHGTRKGK